MEELKLSEFLHTPIKSDQSFDLQEDPDSTWNISKKKLYVKYFIPPAHYASKYIQRRSVSDLVFIQRRRTFLEILRDKQSHEFL